MRCYLMFTGTLSIVGCVASEGGPCRSNGSCDDGLTCASDLCVNVGATAGGEGEEGEGDEGEGEGDGEGEGEGDVCDDVVSGTVVIEDGLDMSLLATVCRIEGDLVLREALIDDLRGLAAIREVTGDLTIERNASLSSLTGLGVLQRVGGDFLIADNPLLASLDGLSSLGEVAGMFVVARNPLTAFSLSLTRGGTVRIVGAPALVSVSLPDLVEVGSVEVSGCPSVAAVQLPVLEHVGALSLVLPEVCTSLSLPRLVQADFIGISAAITLTELSFGDGADIGTLNVSGTGLTSLVLPAGTEVDQLGLDGTELLRTLDLGGASLGGVSADRNLLLEDIELTAAQITSVLVRDNPALSSVRVPNAAAVDGAITIQRNAGLTTIEIPNVGPVAGPLRINDNVALSSLVLTRISDVGEEVFVDGSPLLGTLALPALRHTPRVRVGPDVTVVSLPALETLDAGLGFENSELTAIDVSALRTAGSSLFFQNTALTSFTAPALQQLGELFFVGNDGLTMLSLPLLQSVDGNISISDNSALQVCVGALIHSVGDCIGTASEAEPLVCDGDAGEPDGSILTAQQLPTSTAENGGVRGELELVRCNSQDLDHVAFLVPAGLRGTVSVAADFGAADLGLQLFDPDGQPLDDSNGQHFVEFAESDVDRTLTVRIFLSSPAPAPPDQSYVVAFDAFDPAICTGSEPTADGTFLTGRCSGTFSEGNFPCNGPRLAAPLASDLAGCAGDESADGCGRVCGNADFDVVRIGTLESGRTITATLRFDPALGDLALQLAKVTGSTPSIVLTRRDTDAGAPRDGLVELTFETIGTAKEHMVTVKPEGTAGHRGQPYALSVDASEGE